MSDDEAIESVQDMAELEYWRLIHKFSLDLHAPAVERIRNEAKSAMLGKIAEREAAQS